MVASAARTIARMLIRGYQLFISPLFPPTCRHVPTCSSYAMEAVEKHGAIKGSWLSLKRLLRCHPWGSSGWDPVPEPGSRPEKACAHTRQAHEHHRVG